MSIRTGAGASILDDIEGLRALARSLVRGDSDADDLLQDAAEIAITNPPDDDRPARPWLVAVLRNRWRMDRRGDARRRAREHVVASDAEKRTSGVDGREADTRGDDPLDRARTLERLSTALVALADPYRTVVIRRYLDGETAAQIANAIGVPAGTVRWRLTEGLARLRSAMDEKSPDWKRLLIPFVAVPGAAVKTKSTVGIALAVILFLCAAAGIVLHLTRTPHVDSIMLSPGSGSAVTRAPTVATTAPDGGAFAVPDPLPGQGRALLVSRKATGGEVTGRVINWSTGSGVENAELTFAPTDGGGAQTVRTDPRGAFVLAPPSAGAFSLVAVSATGFLPYAPELMHSGVSVNLAADRAVDGLTIFLFPAVDYGGIVVDEKGAPVAGAKIHLLGTPQGEQQIETADTEWTSDNDGQFVFHAADDAVLEATKGKQRGWGRLTGDVALTHRMVIAIGDYAARDLTIKGVVIDEKGQPVADALVRAEPVAFRAPPKDGPPIGKIERSTAFATSGPDGTFTLEHCDNGNYDLSAEIDGSAPSHTRDVVGGTASAKLVVEAGLPLAGHVVDGEDQPVPAFTLLVAKRTGLLREVVVARSLVAPDGSFNVHVPRGDYVLTASSAGRAPSKPVTASAGDTSAKLVVTDGATLRGSVIDAETKQPLPYARVMREMGGGGASAQPANAGTVTRDDGTFELTGLRPGPVSITIAGGEYHPKIEAGMTAVDGGELGPLVVALTKLKDGETPTTELVGIGVQLTADNDSLVATQVFPGSGALAAGMVVGDHIVALDGVLVTELGMEDSIAHIRGTPGTTIVVSVKRGEQVTPLTVERKKITPQ
ncbi:MAG TPA: sigma-70 family RNA polymerase sigma factor [Kofleriaceae bacterium]